MRIARMRRTQEELIAQWGKTRYDATYALYHWVVYHLLGKLTSGFYLLQKTARKIPIPQRAAFRILSTSESPVPHKTAPSATAGASLISSHIGSDSAEPCTQLDSCSPRSRPAADS